MSSTISYMVLLANMDLQLHVSGLSVVGANGAAI